MFNGGILGRFFRGGGRDDGLRGLIVIRDSFYVREIVIFFGYSKLYLFVFFVICVFLVLNIRFFC